MIRKIARSEHRSEQDIRMHYEIEKSLALQLKIASKEERRSLYTSLYEELYSKVPNISLLAQKKRPEQLQKLVKKQMPFLERVLDKNKIFLEVGPGNCALSFHVANYVKKVYAVDVSETVTHATATPENFSLIISDGCNIPVPESSIDIVYSNQLMEHLHPDDAKEQLQNIYTALAPKGSYLCCTPSRLNGPHDISYYFDEVATGFHLKEYTITELSSLFKDAGFDKVVLYVRHPEGWECKRFPLRIAILLEYILTLLPTNLRRRLVKIKFLKRLMKIHLVGVKK